MKTEDSRESVPMVGSWGEERLPYSRNSAHGWGNQQAWEGPPGNWGIRGECSGQAMEGRMVWNLCALYMSQPWALQPQLCASLWGEGGFGEWTQREDNCWVVVGEGLLHQGG